MIKHEDNITSMFDDDDIYTEGIKDFLKSVGSNLIDAMHGDNARDADISKGKIKDAIDDVKGGDYSDKVKGVKTLNKEVGKPVADALDSAADKFGSWSANTTSLVARARRSVLQFPIYITQTLRVNEAHIISKLFERVYASLVQTVVSQHPYISQDEANDLVFMKQFHTNLKESTDLVFNEYYTPIDEMDAIIRESVFYSEQLTPTMWVEFRQLTELNQDLVLENARLCNEPLTGFSYLREADTRENKEKTFDYDVIKDNEWNDIADAEIKKDKNKRDAYASANPAEQKRMRDETIADMKERIRDGGEDAPTGYSFKGGKYVYARMSRDVRKTGPADAIEVPVLLKDSDIKKTNGMLPYQMVVSFRVKAANGSIDKDVHYVIGIKSVMHLIRVQDLADELRELIMGTSKSLQKVRYKTGEIGFADYMFNIKGIKSDAAKGINTNKKWLNTLKRLGEYQKMNGSLLKKPIEAITGGDVPIPNGTLVLSQSDVTTLVNQTGIDLSVVSTAKRLARTLFLIGIVIVDSSAGSMRVLFPDSDTDWDVQSLASIDAEIAKTDNSQIMRELNRMVNR